MAISKARSSRVWKIGTVVAALVAIAAIDASAHDTWLIAPRATARAGDEFTLRLTSGEEFPVDDFAIEPDRVTRAVQRIGMMTETLRRPSSAAASLRYVVKPWAAGVATYGVELAPKILTLDPSKIDEYLGEIDASPAIRAAWREISKTKSAWVESYSKHATAYVRVLPLHGDTSVTARDRSWSRPLRFGLEIVPLNNPTTLRAGDTLAVMVVGNFKPMRDFAVGAIPEGSAKATFFHTNADGIARVVLPRAGRWLLNGTDLRRSTDPRFVWQSDFVTTTLFVARR